MGAAQLLASLALAVGCHPVSSHTDQITLLSCLTFPCVASKATRLPALPCLSDLLCITPRSLCSGKTDWGLVLRRGHTSPHHRSPCGWPGVDLRKSSDAQGQLCASMYSILSRGLECPLMVLFTDEGRAQS